ncbi:MAG: hypothetical protein CMP52_02790 [Flavobacteriales bacterium]|nr:hypothetical protein [Candidatus Arcticimaribacter sp.]
MDIFYYLKTCDTCKRIIKNLELPDSIKQINIKEKPLTPEQLNVLFTKTKSYSALLNPRAQLLKKRGLKASELSEQESKALILEHYSFLKRPVLIYQNKIFVGNALATVEAAQKTLHG